jgi:hypothetical protein
VEFLNRPDSAGVVYRLGHTKPESVMVEIALPGRNWEVEIHDLQIDGDRALPVDLDLLPCWCPRRARDNARLLMTVRRSLGSAGRSTMLALGSNGVKSTKNRLQVVWLQPRQVQGL